MSVTRRPLRVTPLVAGSLAALLYSNFLLDWVLRGFRGMSDVVSELEAPGEPNATLLRVTDVLCVVLVVALLPAVRRRLPVGVWREVFVVATIVFALGAALAAVVTSPCGPDVVCDVAHAALLTGVHDGSSIVSDTALFLGAAAVWLAVRTTGPAWFRRVAAWFVLLGGVVASAVFGWYQHTGDPAWAVGVSQRVHILSISAWIFSLGLFAARPPVNVGPGAWHDRAVTTGSRHLSVRIDRPLAAVYAFVSDLANLPRWAPGLGTEVVHEDGSWFVETPAGRARVEMTAPNGYGVLDHDVTTPSGETVHVPMRAITDGDGCEVVFTLRPSPGMTDADVERDAALVTADLALLKRVLEA